MKSSSRAWNRRSTSAVLVLSSTAGSWPECRLISQPMARHTDQERDGRLRKPAQGFLRPSRMRQEPSPPNWAKTYAQKISFRASCKFRGNPASEITPKVAVPNAPPGTPN
jgi:hypothetical protein